MLSSRNSHCAHCGHKFAIGEKFDVSPIIELNSPIRWVAICQGHSPVSSARKTGVNDGGTN